MEKKRLPNKTFTPIGRVLESIRADGMVSLRESAVEKLLEGTTTYQEVLRVTSGNDLG